MIDKDNQDGKGRRVWYKVIDTIYQSFGVRIVFEKATKKWLIANPYIMEDDNFEQYMLSTLSTRLLVNDCIAMNERLRLGQYAGGQWMRPVIEAMKESRVIHLTYRKLENGKTKEYTIQPYYIHEYNKSLYLIGKLLNDVYRTYEFGSFLDLEIMKNRFLFEQDVELEYMYRHMYGVMKPKSGQEPERVLLRARDNQPQKMRIKPLHSTQVERSHTAEHTDFELLIYVTNNFISEVFRQKERLEVLRPQWLRDQLWAMYQSGSSIYSPI